MWSDVLAVRLEKSLWSGRVGKETHRRHVGESRQEILVAAPGREGRKDWIPGVKVKVSQLYPTFVHGILQARILEWIAMPAYRGSSRLWDRTLVSYVSCIGRWVFFYH